MLLDRELPGIPGNIVKTAELISQLHKTGQLVVAFSGYTEARSQACLAGADAFISKIDPPEEFNPDAARSRIKAGRRGLNGKPGHGPRFAV